MQLRAHLDCASDVKLVLTVLKCNVVDSDWACDVAVGVDSDFVRVLAEVVCELCVPEGLMVIALSCQWY